jgi:hypothetical protein
MQNQNDNLRDSQNRQLARTLVDAVLQLIQEQKELTDTMRDLVTRVDNLTTMVMGRAPSRSTLPMSRREVTITVCGLIVLAMVVLAISLAQCGCADRPRDFHTDSDSDSVDTVDTAEPDSGVDTGPDGDADGDTDGDLDGDSDGDVDSDTDTDTDSSTDLEVCPWECQTPTNPGWMTCDKFDLIGGEIPKYVRNHNFVCDDTDQWCCQPWPPDTDDDLAITGLCLDVSNHICDLQCQGEIDNKRACFHAQTVCCGQGGTDGVNKIRLDTRARVPAPRARSVDYRSD